MMANAKVSVVIPVYNSSEYIEKCAESLFSQTLEGIEYVFVNDGSTDDSIARIYNVLERFPNRSLDVKVVDLEQNSGIHVAMKRGIQECTGDFIIRCDSDDWVRNDAYELLTSSASETGSDVVICSLIQQYDNGSEVSHVREMQRDEYVASIMKGETPAYLCNMLVRSSIYHSLHHFAVGGMWEDVPVAIQILCMSECISFLDEPLYYYYQRPTSICHDDSTQSIYKKWKGAVDNALLTESVITGSMSVHGFSKEIAYLKMRAMFYGYPLLSDRTFREQFRSTVKKMSIFDIVFNGIIPLRQRFGYLLRYLGFR